MLILEKLSFGVGDRFAHQARAQLRAFEMLHTAGVDVVPVWNKSHREHSTIGSAPEDVRRAADAAVKEARWPLAHYVDADHVRLETVAGFVESSDFFTLDVADFIGPAPPASDEGGAASFVARHPELVGRVEIPGIEAPFETTKEQVQAVAAKYLAAVAEAGRSYRHIAGVKGVGTFITEVSMDETDAPQTPPELLVILAALADEGIPLQTIAPKFSGRFNKGVDYVGDPAQFERELGDDIAVIAHAVARYDLPANLKLSVHSGSDKFSLYAPIRRTLARTGAGLHLKTAGTTWLEELIGLAEAGGSGLALAKEIYALALEKQAELCAPYASVIDINPALLPSAATVNGWTSEQFTAALRHDPTNPSFNPGVRQLLHVGYKIAAQLGARYTDALQANQATIARNVTHNLFERHMKLLFLKD